jgi:hypothetical protein
MIHSIINIIQLAFKLWSLQREGCDVLEKNKHIVSYKSNSDNQMSIKCSHCNCMPSECIISKSAKECPNCSLQECCCWVSINTIP